VIERPDWPKSCRGVLLVPAGTPLFGALLLNVRSLILAKHICAAYESEADATIKI
jgi:hypothetical protein